MSILPIAHALAQASSAPTTAPLTDAPWWARPSGQFLPLIIIFGLMYVFVFRANRGKEKKRKNMLETLKRGDRVQTIGGILGTVVELRENNTEVVVKVDENTNTKLRFSRSAIHRVLDDEAAPK